MQRQVPATPRIISPTPTPTDADAPDYFDRDSDPAPRRSTRLQNKTRDAMADSPDPELRARSRSRDTASLRKRRLSGKPAPTTPSAAARTAQDLRVEGRKQENGQNGHLLSPGGMLSSSLRGLSRSPSPLGLIPIHQSWRSFIHRHEIPRKALHVSIGFLTLFLYARGFQARHIHPVLLAALLPIAAADALRQRWPPFNRVYVRAVGAFMRESEVHDRYNGVIWYLLGAWAALRFAPKDVAVMAVVLLSWCDTAASTAGRALGRYTPRLRPGKSLAGSLAAALVGAAAAALFWGVVAPAAAAPAGPAVNDGPDAFAFRGALALPARAAALLGVPAGAALRGPAALAVVSVVAGVVASASEAVDLFGFDDNVSIPVLCGLGLWGFLRVFGAA